MNAKEIIEILNMKPIPEGGMCTENFGSDVLLPVEMGGRRLYSTIYYLLEERQCSAFHRLQSDEVWTYHAGASFQIYMIQNGSLHTQVLGIDLKNGEQPQVLVPGGTIFGATVKGAWGLSGCVSSPGFHDDDLEFIGRAELSDVIRDEGFLQQMTLF